MGSTREARLYQYLMSVQHEQFQLGFHDCATFVCRWVDMELGTNYLERVKTDLNYSVETHAVRAIAKRGGYDLLVQRYCGDPCDPKTEQFDRGDIALYANHFGSMTLGILGERLVYGPGMDGILASDAMNAVKFWRLECLKQQPR